MKNAFKEIFEGFYSLVAGMRITIREFFKPVVTVQYPHETLKIPKRFRGHIELVQDPETGRAICYACGLCARACPSDCITVEGVKLEGAKKKSANHYVLDFTKCSLCGACVEACRDSAIRFSRDYNLAGVEKDKFVMDLFRKLEREAGRDPDGPLSAAPVVPARPVVVAAPAPAVPVPVKLDPAKPAALKEEAKCS